MQHKQSLRKSLRSALSHKKLADELLDSLKLGQESLNAVLDKLDADSNIALDQDYASTLSIDSVFEGDNEGSDAQHKQSLRKSLRSALSHRRLANEIIDAWEELHVAHNALLVKLDAEAGTLNDTDYESSLSLEVIDAESALLDAQHKQSSRKSLISALAHRKLANALLDGIIAAQEAFNATLVLLDAGSVNGAHAGNKISVIDPEGY